jgi:hypothetical protein
LKKWISPLAKEVMRADYQVDESHVSLLEKTTGATRFLMGGSGKQKLSHGVTLFRLLIAQQPEPLLSS